MLENPRLTVHYYSYIFYVTVARQDSDIAVRHVPTLVYNTPTLPPSHDLPSPSASVSRNGRRRMHSGPTEIYDIVGRQMRGLRIRCGRQ